MTNKKYLKFETVKVNTKILFTDDCKNFDFEKIFQAFQNEYKGLIIIGPNGSGKSTIAYNTIAKYYPNINPATIDGRYYDSSINFNFGHCTEETKVIIADGFQRKEDLCDFLLFTMDTILVDRHYKTPLFIDPKIIIICDQNINFFDLPQGVSLYKRFKVINLFTKENKVTIIGTYSLYKLPWELPKMKEGDWFYIKSEEYKWELYDENQDYFFIRNTISKQIIAIQKLRD